jgi:hypothetical protein
MARTAAQSRGRYPNQLIELLGRQEALNRGRSKDSVRRSAHVLTMRAQPSSHSSNYRAMVYADLEGHPACAMHRSAGVPKAGKVLVESRAMLG